jgi:hypothetical protein
VPGIYQTRWSARLEGKRIMKPVDIRNETFGDITARLDGDRLSVYQAFQIHGNRTTRGLAFSMGWDVLRVRPRVTELFQIDLVQLVERDGHEGVYAAVPLDDAREAFDQRRKEALSHGQQRELELR